MVFYAETAPSKNAVQAFQSYFFNTAENIEQDNCLIKIKAKLGL